MRRGSPIQFFQETIAELRKSVWPTREETMRLTYIVILLSSIIGFFFSRIGLCTFSDIRRIHHPLITSYTRWTKVYQQNSRGEWL